MKKLRCIAVVMLSCALVLTGIWNYGFADELSDAEKEKQRLEERKEETEATLAQLEEEKTDIMTKIEKLDEQMKDVNERLETVTKDLKIANEELDIINVSLAAVQAKEESQYETMKKRIKYMYENGSQGYLDIIMEAKDISEMLNRVEYVNRITQYDNEMLQNYTEIKEEVERQKTIAEDKKSQLRILQDEVTLEQENLEELVAQKEKELTQYNKNIKNASKDMQEYVTAIAEKEKEIEKMLLEKAKEDGYDTFGSLVQSSAGFRWPLSIAGTITSRFGPRSAPTAGASTNHKGLDIAAPNGTSILAAKEGKVVTSTYSTSAGNYVMINHGDGLYTVYMHASKLCVSVGDQVTQGQKVAEVGSTGFSTGPHLHFSVIINGTYVNPELYLPEQ